jgi:hypothetical protein
MRANVAIYYGSVCRRSELQQLQSCIICGCMSGGSKLSTQLNGRFRGDGALLDKLGITHGLSR